MFESGGSVEHLASVVGEACQRLSAANIPHNLFVVDCGQRVFLFPNAFARAKAHGEVPSDLLDSQVRTLACPSFTANPVHTMGSCMYLIGSVQVVCRYL